MRIAIVACDHFKRELEALTEGEDDFVMREDVGADGFAKDAEEATRVVNELLNR